MNETNRIVTALLPNSKLLTCYQPECAEQYVAQFSSSCLKWTFFVGIQSGHDFWPVSVAKNKKLFFKADF